MLAATDPRVKKITVMCCTQLMKTELINNLVGYFIHQDPRPMIVMQPTVGLAETWSKDRLDKMLRDTPVLQGRVKEKRSKDGENTILHKSFPGGHVTMVGSNSPTELASRPVSVVLCDEVDKYPASAGKEGDPIKLIEERTDTFWNALSVRVCSPTVKNHSRIEHEYELSDKRVFCGLCPHCGALDELKWENVKWEKEAPEVTAHYECGACKAPWTEPDRLKAIGKGEYIATAPFNGHAGFKVNKIASPWQPLSVLVRKFLEAVKAGPDILKTFVNTQLAETWEEEGEKPDFQRLYERREHYAPNTLPEGVIFLTAAVDVQANRFETEIVGWGRDKQSWSIDYRVIMANTADQKSYELLDPLLNEYWTTKAGRQISIRMLTIDSGHATQEVYTWVRRHPADRVRAIDGKDKMQTIVGTPTDVDINRDGRRLKRALKLWSVGIDVAKSQLYGWLQLDIPEDGQPYPPGYCHFPQYDLEHFKRLTAEQLMTVKAGNKTVHKWVKVHERNEQLDIRVYNRAAAAMFGIDRFSDVDWDALDGKFDYPGPRPTRPAPTGANLKPQGMAPGFWDRQKGKKLF